MVEESDKPQPRWTVTAGNLVVTVGNLAFLAYTAGIVTERLNQVSSALSAHVGEYSKINASARLATLEAQVAQERIERVEMKQEILGELKRINERLDDVR